MPFDFSQWPPSLSPDQIDVLHLRAARYALSHGLLYLPPGTQPSSGIPTSAIHAPFSLLPTPVPRAQFEHAKKIQSIYNVLYAQIAMDTEFLDTVMGTERGVGKVDDFVGRLWNGWKKLRDAGLEQVSLLLYAWPFGVLIDPAAVAFRSLPFRLPLAFGRRWFVIETSRIQHDFFVVRDVISEGFRDA